jgi:two-component system, OmpR family, phosphate regulon sensor histidine kinase PhoR
VEDIRWKAFWLYCFFALCCLIIWGIYDLTTALTIFSIGLSIYILNHLFWLHKLHRWLKKPILAKIPRGYGIWEDVLSTLYQEQRRNSRQQTQLSATLGRFTHAASALPDGVVVLNAQNEIEWCNKPAESILGLNLLKDKAKPINYLVRHNAFLAYLNSQEYTEPIKIKSWLSDDTIEFQIIDYGTRQKLLISRDVTQLEKIDTMRRDLIANVSHELRTPLTVVGGFLETLMDMDGAIPERTRTYFNMMQDQTLRMKLLIDDLLVLSQIESNAHGPEDTLINMRNLISMLENDANGLSQGKHRIQIQVNTDINLTGAISEIQSALSNLVSNAIRYTPEGGNVQIHWDQQNEKGIFSVKDDGIGIAPEHIERLTERFYRVDRGRSRLTGGTGLGLSIVKHILMRHQAVLNVESEIDQGSTFMAVFPKERLT